MSGDVPENTCPTGKITYPSDREARKTLTRLIRHRAVRGDQRIEDHSYQCPECGAWHLTSKTRAESW